MSRFVRVCLLAVLGVSLVSCSLVNPNRVHKVSNPDYELPRLIKSWTDAREAELRKGGRFLNSESIRYELERLSYENPRHIPAHLACASIAFEVGEPSKAATHLDDVFAIQPAHPEAAILRSRIALQEGNTPYARELLEIQIQLVPDHGELRAAHAGVAFLEGDYESARASLAAARRLGAEEWRIAYNQGLVEEAAGNSSEAARQYTMCLEFQPGFEPAQSRLNGLE